MKYSDTNDAWTPTEPVGGYDDDDDVHNVMMDEDADGFAMTTHPMDGDGDGDGDDDDGRNRNNNNRQRATGRTTVYGWLVKHKMMVGLILMMVGLFLAVTILVVAVVVPVKERNQSQSQQQQQQVDNVGKYPSTSTVPSNVTSDTAGESTTEGTPNIVQNTPPPTELSLTPPPSSSDGSPDGTVDVATTTMSSSPSSSPSIPHADTGTVTDSPTSSPSTSVTTDVGDDDDDVDTATGTVDDGYCTGEYYDDPCYSPDHKDRLGHGDTMKAGKAVCSGNFKFGLTLKGILQWKNCVTNATRIIWDSTTADITTTTTDPTTNISSLAFVMDDTGTFQVVRNGNGTGVVSPTIVWEKKCLRNVQFYSQCLSSLRLDCPYIHLHANGDLVMNHISPIDGRWKATYSPDVYFDLWWKSNGIPSENEISKIVNRNPDQGDCIHYSTDFTCLQDKMGHNNNNNDDDGTSTSVPPSINSMGSRFVLPYGKAICNGNYMFGFSTTNRALQWKDCLTNETKVLYDLNNIVDRYNNDITVLDYTYFVMSDDASVQVGVDGRYGSSLGSSQQPSQSMAMSSPLWYHNATINVGLFEACVNDDWLLDCPYIQISQSGNLDLSYMVDNNDGLGMQLQRRKMDSIYTFFP